MTPPAPPTALEDLFEFPCDFPLKVIGKTVEGLAQAVLDIVLQHAPDFDPAGIELRSSRTGKYLSITCTLRAQSRAQLDALYRALSAHPLVDLVL